MSALAYYNENDPEKCAALEAMMADGHIAPGMIDNKDIRDVNPDELSRFTQCHFFAGIGLWSAAARAVGIPDDFPLWSGSCPCQPFSAAGTGEGHADDRHLWPHWFWLIYQRRPFAVRGWNRLRAKTDLHGSKLYRLIWKDRNMPGGQSIYALRASGRPISVSGSICAGWGTPQKRDHKGAHSEERIKAMKAEGHGMQDLPDQAMMAGWATASARDWKDSEGMATEREDGRSRLDQLPRQAFMTGWTTSAHSDGARGGTGITEGMSGSSLPQMAKMVDLIDLSGWQTPTKMEGGQTSRGGNRKEELLLGGQANAAMLDLMGWHAPTAGDHNRGDYQRDRGESGKERLSNRGAAKAAAIKGEADRKFAIRCKVQQTASGPMLIGCSAEILMAQNCGQLDPAHSAWLQGIPPELQNSVRMGMRSISKWRKNS